MRASSTASMADRIGAPARLLGDAERRRARPPGRRRWPPPWLPMAGITNGDAPSRAQPIHDGAHHHRQPVDAAAPHRHGDSSSPRTPSRPRAASSRAAVSAAGSASAWLAEPRLDEHLGGQRDHQMSGSFTGVPSFCGREVGGQAQLHRLLRVEDAQVRLAAAPHGVHQLVDLVLERMMAHVRAVGHDRAFDADGRAAAAVAAFAQRDLRERGWPAAARPGPRPAVAGPR